jgi:hypothetical protein
MTSWHQFATARPDLAEIGLGLLPPCGIAYLGTVRRDGGPRVHPVCPVFGRGRLFVGVGPNSPKKHHLRRDPRCVLHALLGNDDAEFVIRARAVQVTDPGDRELFETACRDAGVNVEADGPAFGAFDRLRYADRRDDRQLERTQCRMSLARDSGGIEARLRSPMGDHQVRSRVSTTESVGMVEDLSDPRRTEPPFVLDEREMLEQWLEFHRVTLLLKCDGLEDRDRKARPVATSKLSLHGLVRHMAEVERNWFTRVLLRQTDAGMIWSDPTIEDSELVPLDDADWQADVATWLWECDHSRSAVASHFLDDTGVRNGEPCSLRWIYVHMIEEYARHNGHADLIRELVDGAVGW